MSRITDHVSSENVYRQLIYKGSFIRRRGETRSRNGKRFTRIIIDPTSYHSKFNFSFKIEELLSIKGTGGKSNKIVECPGEEFTHKRSSVRPCVCPYRQTHHASKDSTCLCHTVSLLFTVTISLNFGRRE